jgi:cytochrome P450
MSSKGASTVTDTAQAGFRMEDAPMAADRTAGWRYVRSAGDVFEANGAWYLTSRQAVEFAQRHPELFASGGAYDGLGSPVRLIPLAVDPPDHVRFRRVLDPMLAPRVINGIEDELRSQVRDLVAAFADKGECDVVRDVARLYPTQVFLTLFGLPLDDRDQFIEWVETIVEAAAAGSGQPAAEIVDAGTALFGYLQGFIDLKRQHPGDDMLSRVLALTGDQAFSNDEVLGLCFLFTLAGLDTVTAAIGFVMLHLAQNADLRRRVGADASLVGPVVEEVLRLELPAPTVSRVTTADVELCGRRIPKGARVVVCLAAANRDQAAFDRPDELDLGHGERGHLTFGGGIHRCLGSHLARRELRLVVDEFHRLIPEYELAPGSEPQVVWPSGTLHLAELPLVFPVGRRA